MNAIILAAGRGERMRPLSDKIPKPLLKVHSKPLIVWHIEKLASLGFNQIVINIDYLGEKIVQTLGDGSDWGINLLYSDERQSGALESAGGIKKAISLIESEKILVINGDIWSDYEFETNFDLKGDLAHLILVPNPTHNAEGDFALNKQRVINDAKQKFTFSGIGYYSTKLFDEIGEEKAPLAPLLRKAVENSMVSGSLYQGRWYDIGTPQRLDEINSTSV